MSLGLMQYVTSEAKRKPARVFLFAQEKWGKTSFAAHAPNPVFAMTRGEDGLLTLVGAGRLNPTPHFPEEVSRWRQVREITAALRTEEHDRRTFVLDTANGLARILAEHVCIEEFQGNWQAFDAYGRGEKLCLAERIEFLAELDAIREERGMSIILLSHSNVKTFKNPSGPDYDRYEPLMSKELWSVTHKWCDAILFGSFRVLAALDKNAKDKRAKGQGGTDRVLFTGESAAHLGGNRYGLPAEIDCGATPAGAWKAFATAMSAAKPKPAAPAPAKPAEQKPAEQKPEAAKAPEQQKPAETKPPLVDDGINEPPGLGEPGDTQPQTELFDNRPDGNLPD